MGGGWWVMKAGSGGGGVVLERPGPQCLPQMPQPDPAPSASGTSRPPSTSKFNKPPLPLTSGRLPAGCLKSCGGDTLLPPGPPLSFLLGEFQRSHQILTKGSLTIPALRFHPDAVQDSGTESGIS